MRIHYHMSNQPTGFTTMNQENMNARPRPILGSVKRELRPPVNVMIDIETLGQGPDACVAEIGACATVCGTRQQLELKVSLSSSVEAGGRIDAETVQWWLARDDAARSRMASTGGRVPVKEALLELSCWIQAVRDASGGVCIWSCGTDFDITILAGYYRRLRMELPWKFWEARDYRTLRAVFLEVPKPSASVAHTALRDAMDQLDHLVMILAHVESLRKEADNA